MNKKKVFRGIAALVGVVFVFRRFASKKNASTPEETETSAPEETKEDE